ncbi:MAG: UDP-glucose/GDP-mannose dehydrogenase family protein, partial [Synergistaceae bacterium]|nr:UDP-glucose/GDP-mannose dehydrogenase family protein [Synergistaceae bacterium]
MKLIVVGTGYVGLVTGVCLAKFGNDVVCIDTNEEKIEALSRGEVPFYEPGLSEIIQNNLEAGRLSFSTDLASALDDGEMCFITVGTPSLEGGGADLADVKTVAETIGRRMKGYKLVVVKSTVPVGSCDFVRQTIAAELEKRGEDIPFDVASNPEFLREGAAVRDFLEPDRVVAGTDSDRAASLMKELYSFLPPEKILFMDIRSSEMAKYAANAMLATRISFMNELAAVCERLGAYVEKVRLGMGSDSRIGYAFLNAG